MNTKLQLLVAILFSGCTTSTVTSQPLISTNNILINTTKNWRVDDTYAKDKNQGISEQHALVHTSGYLVKLTVFSVESDKRTIYVMKEVLESDDKGLVADEVDFVQEIENAVGFTWKYVAEESSIFGKIVLVSKDNKTILLECVWQGNKNNEEVNSLLRTVKLK